MCRPPPTNESGITVLAKPIALSVNIFGTLLLLPFVLGLIPLLLVVVALSTLFDGVHCLLCAPEPVVVFLRGLGRQCHWETPKTNVELLENVEDALLAADLVSLGAWESDRGIAGRHRLRCAVALSRVVQGDGRASRHGSDRG